MEEWCRDIGLSHAVYRILNSEDEYGFNDPKEFLACKAEEFEKVCNDDRFPAEERDRLRRANENMRAGKQPEKYTPPSASVDDDSISKVCDSVAPRYFSYLQLTCSYCRMTLASCD